VTIDSLLLTRRGCVSGAAALALTACRAHTASTASPAPPASPASPASPAVRAALALNENPFGPSPAAVAAIRAHLDGLARYTGDEAGALEAEIATLEGVPVDHVVLGEVLEPLGVHLALAGGPGGEFVYATPGYTALVDTARAAGGAAVGVPLEARLSTDLPALRARVGDRTRAVFVVNPHNPTGTASDPDALFAFVREVGRRAVVVVDEAYLDFLDDFAARTCARAVREGENVVVFRTFSKLHGLAALAFGYALMPGPLAAALKRTGVSAPRALNRLAVAAARASLGDTAFLAQTRARVAAERARWTAFLDARGLRHTEARGNFVFFETGRPHAEVAAAMRARGVDIGRAFPPYERWARISIGLPEENSLAQEALHTAL
jgi:histidinol-phosphate aminotransferase